MFFCVFLLQAPSAERQPWLQPPSSAQPWDSDPPVGSAAITKFYIRWMISTLLLKSFFILHTTLISIPQSAFPRNNYVQPFITPSHTLPIVRLDLMFSVYFFLYLSTSYTEKWSCLISSFLGLFVTYVYMIYFTFILSPFISLFSCFCKLLCFGYSNLL